MSAELHNAHVGDYYITLHGVAQRELRVAFARYRAARYARLLRGATA